MKISKLILGYCIVFFLIFQSISAQSPEPLRTEYEAFESSAVYVQWKKGTIMGDVVINKNKLEILQEYPALTELFQQDHLIEMHLAFRALARKNEKFNRIYRLKTSGVIDLNSLVQRLALMDDIQLCEKIPMHNISVTPNDLDYGDPNKRWHLDRINAELAWDVSEGCSDVKIAIVDDAVLTSHQDLVSKIYTNTAEIPNNGVDDDGNGYIDDVHGFDVSDNDPDASPPSTATSNYFSHGTHVAGIAGGATDNGLGMASIGFNSSIIPVKTKSNSSLDPTSLTNPMEGVEYAIAIGADIINMSWGSYAYSEVNQMVFDQANVAGITCVAAVGNNSLPFIAYPANYNGVISVVATDNSDQLASFTNFSPEQHIYAPGTNIWSAEATSTAAYGYKSGTSMSTPLVSGLIGLMICNNPEYSLFDIQYCLHYNADDIPSTTTPGLTIPRVNAHQSMECTLPLINLCEPDGCELVENGSMEIPSYANLNYYDDFGGIYFGELCGWENLPRTTDIFPLDVNAPDHFAHMQCQIGDFELYEGLVSKNPLDLDAGKTYKFEFDYSVLRLQNYMGADHLDSIAIKLVKNDWDQPFGTYTIVDSTILLGAILDPPLDHVVPNWVFWLDNAVVDESHFNHYSMTFVAPENLNIRKLIIHPVNDYPTPGVGRTGLAVDNISIQPVTDVIATASNYSPLPNDCVTLSASTPATYVYWEPDYLFEDPTLPVQTICLDSISICQGGMLEFTVTAMDTAVGCSSSDLVVLDVQGTDEFVPLLNEPELTVYSSCEQIDYLTPPTAFDNCDGAIQGVPDVSFPITESTTIIWSFSDSSGNTITQSQDVVIVTGIDASFSLMGDTLVANQAGASYQWINCSTNEPIPGEVDQTFIPSTSGLYAVEITMPGCMNTSECITSTVGIDDLEYDQLLTIMPNPSTGQLTINFSIGQIERVEVLAVDGRLIKAINNINSSNAFVDLSSLAKGVYVLRSTTRYGDYIKRIVLK